MTLIVLLILAAVSLSAVFSEKGIFSRAEKASTKYNEAKAREVLETVLIDRATTEKYSNPEYNQNDFLDKLIKEEIEDSEVRENYAIVGGYIYELNRSVPKIEKYVGKYKDIEFPEVNITTKLADEKNFMTITITANEEKNGINKIEIWLLGEKVKEYTYNTVKSIVTEEYITKQNGKYTIKTYGNLNVSKTVEVNGIMTSVKFESNGNEEWKKEHSTTVTIQETEDKVVNAIYVWTNSVTTPEDNQFVEEQTFKSGDTITNNQLNGTYYLWTMLTTQSGEKIKLRSEGFNFDNEGPKITAFEAKGEGLDINVNTTVIDNESGVKEITYSISPTTGIPANEVTGKLISGTTLSIHTNKIGNYEITIRAVDNSGQESIEKRSASSNTEYVQNGLLLDYEARTDYGRGFDLTNNTWNNVAGTSYTGKIYGGQVVSGRVELDGIDDWIQTLVPVIPNEVTLEIVATLKKDSPRRRTVNFINGRWRCFSTE